MRADWFTKSKAEPAGCNGGICDKSERRIKKLIEDADGNAGYVDMDAA